MKLRNRIIFVSAIIGLTLTSVALGRTGYEDDCGFAWWDLLGWFCRIQ